MSTRSAIILEHEDGTARGIYCHSDGYTEHHKPILLGHYKSLEKVKALMDLGDISSLAENIGTKHDIHNAPDDEVNAYGRDGGQTNVASERGDTWREAMRKIHHNGHVYVFRAKTENWWYVGYANDTDPDSDELVHLEDVKES